MSGSTPASHALSPGRVRGVRVLQTTVDDGHVHKCKKSSRSKKCDDEEESIVEAALESSETIGEEDDTLFGEEPKVEDDDNTEKDDGSDKKENGTEADGAVTEETEEGDAVDGEDDDEAPTAEETDIADEDIVEEAIAAPTEVEDEQAVGEEMEDSAAQEDESDTDANTMTVGAYLISLEPFSIEIDYGGEPVTEDPGMQGYLYQEMKAELDNLYKIELQMSSGATVEEAQAAATNDNNKQRRHLVQQYLYYTGTAYFDGAPVHEEQTVRDLQASILSDTEAVTSTIGSSLGTSNTGASDDLSVSSVVMDSQQASSSGENGDDSDGLSTTGLAIVIVASVIGGLALVVIVCGEYMTTARVAAQGTTHNYVLDAKESPMEDDDRTKEDSPTVDLNQVYDENA